MTDYRWFALLAWLPAMLNYFCVMLFLVVVVLGERRRPPSARQSRQSYGIAAIVAYLCSLASAGTVLFCVYFGEPWLAVMLAGGSTFRRQLACADGSHHRSSHRARTGTAYRPLPNEARASPS